MDRSDKPEPLGGLHRKVGGVDYRICCDPVRVGDRALYIHTDGTCEGALFTILTITSFDARCKVLEASDVYYRTTEVVSSLLYHLYPLVSDKEEAIDQSE